MLKHAKVSKHDTFHTHSAALIPPPPHAMYSTKINTNITHQGAFPSASSTAASTKSHPPFPHSPAVHAEAY